MNFLIQRKRRKDITKERPLYKRTRNTPDNYGISEAKYNEVVSKGLLSKKQVQERRDKIKLDFPNVVTDVYTYDCLDQGLDGACMIAATFNLLNIVGKNKLHGLDKRKREKSWKTLKQARSWTKLYWDVVQNANGKYTEEAGDYDQLLENGATKKPFVNMLNDPSFRYVPILSDGRENNFNKDIINLNFPNDPIRGVREFIEGLVDRKIPVAISWNGHARVVVGYNNFELLFADSWGNNFEELTIMNVVETSGKRQMVKDDFRAGFSSIDKRFIYPNIRDCMYFEKEMTIDDLSKKVEGLKMVNLEAKPVKKKLTSPSDYLKSVDVEVKEMQKLLKDSGKQREEHIESIILSGRRKDPIAQRQSIDNTLEACVSVESNGSGSIITHNGKTFVLTNEHVGESIGTLKFIMWIDGTIGVAQTTYIDKDNDIAKMKIVQVPSKKEIKSLSIHKDKVRSNQIVVQVHNPYHWGNDENGYRIENDNHFPFTVETRNIKRQKESNNFFHSTRQDSSVFFGSSGSPLIYRDSNGILGGVVGIHKQWYDNDEPDKKFRNKFEGVWINDQTLKVLPNLKF